MIVLFEDLGSEFVQCDILTWFLTRLLCTIIHLLWLTTAFVTPSKADADYIDSLCYSFLFYELGSLEL